MKLDKPFSLSPVPVSGNHRIQKSYTNLYKYPLWTNSIKHAYLLNTNAFLQMDNIHRAGCTALDCSSDGRHLATAGDRVVKIWDYHMRLDLNFQVNY